MITVNTGILICDIRQRKGTVTDFEKGCGATTPEKRLVSENFFHAFRYVLDIWKEKDVGKKRC